MGVIAPNQLDTIGTHTNQDPGERKKKNLVCSPQNESVCNRVTLTLHENVQEYEPGWLTQFSLRLTKLWKLSRVIDLGNLLFLSYQNSN